MAQWNMKSKKKKTGGLRVRSSKKHKRQAGSDFLPAIVSAKKIKAKRTSGGGAKRTLLGVDTANVIVGSKAQKAKIISVADNRADSHFIRRNIVTKGAIIDTDLGRARVTSRPGQHGIVNAVLTETTSKTSVSREEKKK